MKNSKLLPLRWLKRILIVIFPLILGLALIGNYVIDYYAKALTQAGGWPITGSPADLGLVYEDVTLTTADGLHISAWYLPGHSAKAVILAHGIWANKQQLYPAAIMLVEAGYHVLAIDLRGHGLSEGEKITYGYYEALDVQAGVDYLLARPGIEKVGAIGYSFGGAAVVRAAAKDERIQAVVIESSFSSLADAVNDSFSRLTHLSNWPFAPLIVKAAERELDLTVEQVDSARDLALMSPRPILIIHGSNDDLFPVSQAYKLYKAAQEPKELWVIEGLTHNLPMEHQQEYRERVMRFFEAAFAQ